MTVGAKKLEQFKAWALKIEEGIKERDENRDDPRFDTPLTSADGYYLSEMYKTGCEKIDKDKISDIVDIAKELNQSASGTIEENPFEWLLLAQCAALGPVDAAARARCKRLALQLMFAHVNKVKLKKLIQFLYVSGKQARIQRLLKSSKPDLFTRKPRRKKKSQKAVMGARTLRRRLRAERLPRRIENVADEML